METFEELYQNSQCGYLSWKINGELVRLNQTLANWLGYDKDFLISEKKIYDLLTVSSKIYYETHLAPLVFIQGSVKEIQLDLLTKSGEQIPVLINAVLKRLSDSPDDTYIRATVFDISQRKKFENELLLEKRRAEEALKKVTELNAELETFAQIVSHDLRSPLSGILSLTTHIIEDSNIELSPKLKKSLSLINETSIHLSRYVEGLLSFHRTQFTYCDSVVRINFKSFISRLLSAYQHLALETQFNSQLEEIIVNQTVL